MSTAPAGAAAALAKLGDHGRAATPRPHRCHSRRRDRDATRLGKAASASTATTKVGRKKVGRPLVKKWSARWVREKSRPSPVKSGSSRAKVDLPPRKKLAPPVKSWSAAGSEKSSRPPAKWTSKGRVGRRKGSGTRAAQTLSCQGQPGITIPELASKMASSRTTLPSAPGLEQDGKLEKKAGWHPKG